MQTREQEKKKKQGGTPQKRRRKQRSLSVTTLADDKSSSPEKTQAEAHTPQKTVVDCVVGTPGREDRETPVMIRSPELFEEHELESGTAENVSSGVSQTPTTSQPDIISPPEITPKSPSTGCVGVEVTELDPANDEEEDYGGLVESSQPSRQEIEDFKIALENPNENLHVVFNGGVVDEAVIACKFLSANGVLHRNGKCKSPIKQPH